MSKMLFFLVVLFGNTLPMLSQNEYRADDELSLQYVSFFDLYKNDSKGLLWDFSQNEPLPKEQIVKYLANRDTTICANIASFDQKTKYLYDQVDDSIFVVGFRNNKAQLKYDFPELELRLPISCGDSVAGVFSAKGVDVHGDFVRVFGKYKYEVSNVGTLITIDGDTLHNTLLVHKVRFLVSKFEKKEDMLAQYGSLDKIPNLSPEEMSIFLTKDTMFVVNDIYRWYALGFRYPIFKQETICDHNDALLYSSTLYCSTESQKKLDDAVNDQIREYVHKESVEEERLQNGPLANDNYDLSFDSSYSSLTLNFELTSCADVSYGVYTPEGFSLYYSKIGKLRQALHHISVDAHSINIYGKVFTLFVDGIPFSKKIK